MRELAPTEKVAPDQVAFVQLEGLGKVPFSNIRRPRPLMDVTPDDLQRAAAAGEVAREAGAGGGGGAAGGDGGRPQRRRLEQEPMLAARIMIEDCFALILDVLDIDQIFVAAGGSECPTSPAVGPRHLRRRLLPLPAHVVLLSLLVPWPALHADEMLL